MLYTLNTYNFSQLYLNKAEKKFNPLHYSCLENPMDRGARQGLQKPFHVRNTGKKLEKVQVNDRKISTFSLCLNHANATFIYM